MRLRSVSTSLLLAATLGLAACNTQPSASARGVYFIEPVDGATVSSPFKVVFGLRGMQIKPAGEIAEGSGHHHLIVDGDAIKAGDAVPANDTHIHFGKGQTETELKLAPGKHRLTLQFADGYHVSYGPAMAASITVTVRPN